VHGGGNGLHEVKKSRRCRAPIVGVAAARPWLRGKVLTQWSWSVKEDTGNVGAGGRRGEYGEGGNGESMTANNFNEHTNVTETNQRPAFAVYRTAMVRMNPHVKRCLCTPIEHTVRKKPRTQVMQRKEAWQPRASRTCAQVWAGQGQGDAGHALTMDTRGHGTRMQ